MSIKILTRSYWSHKKEVGLYEFGNYCVYPFKSDFIVNFNVFNQTNYLEKLTWRWDRLMWHPPDRWWSSGKPRWHSLHHTGTCFVLWGWWPNHVLLHGHLSSQHLLLMNELLLLFHIGRGHVPGTHCCTVWHWPWTHGYGWSTRSPLAESLLCEINRLRLWDRIWVVHLSLAWHSWKKWMC